MRSPAAAAAADAAISAAAGQANVDTNDDAGNVGNADTTTDDGARARDRGTPVAPVVAVSSASP